jgi:hypothetical protein
MSHLADELVRLFPEISRPNGGTEELPYVLMANLVYFLEGQANPERRPRILDRVLEFSRWVQNQPPGKDARDDVGTIFVVGFLESVLESRTLEFLVPHLISKAELLKGRDYWVQWVGEDNYARALTLY